MALVTERDSDFKQQREQLYRELDRGIRDMEQGDLIPHDEAMRVMRMRLHLDEV